MSSSTSTSAPDLFVKVKYSSFINKSNFFFLIIIGSVLILSPTQAGFFLHIVRVTFSAAAAGSAAAGANQYTDLTPVNATLTATYLLKLNGHDRFAARPAIYFSRVQVNDHHSGSGGIDSNVAGSSKANDAIGVYSFALKPEEHQPSGTCNFSRIDNAQLVGAAGGAADTIFAVNYNVLRIMSGMGGLAYSN